MNKTVKNKGTTYKDEFLKEFNIKTIEDFNKHITERKPLDLGLFLSKMPNKSKDNLK